jgi:hypothetical protein
MSGVPFCTTPSPDRPSLKLQATDLSPWRGRGEEMRHA